MPESVVCVSSLRSGKTTSGRPTRTRFPLPLQSHPLQPSHVGARRFAAPTVPAATVVVLYNYADVCARAGREVGSPLERLSVRLLPRPHGLASSQFQKLFVTCCARAKNLPPPPSPKNTDVRPMLGGVNVPHPTPRGRSWAYMFTAKGCILRLSPPDACRLRIFVRNLLMFMIIL